MNKTIPDDKNFNKKDEKIKFETLHPKEWIQALKTNLTKSKKINFENISLQEWVNSFQAKLEEKKQTIKFETLNPKEWIQSLQDNIEKVFSSENNEVILKQSKHWASAITWVLMSGTVFGIGWISFAETEEIVIAVGKLQPEGGVIDVQIPVEGIAREILVKEGDRVKKGQVLIRLDSEINEAKNASLIKSLELNQLIKEKLSNLVKEGAVSELQYLEQTAKVEEIKSNLKINVVRRQYQEISSPANGIVFELKPKGPGYVARASEPVLKIVPIANLIAKVEIDSRTIGFVKKGQLAEISIDSFPASDFGAIDATVSNIGSDALAPKPSEGKGYRFPAELILENQFLEKRNGNKLPLQSGMSLSANIKMRKVTYLKLLLNKFTDKTDSLKSI